MIMREKCIALLPVPAIQRLRQEVLSSQSALQTQVDDQQNSLELAKNASATLVQGFFCF
ncbi:MULTISPECIES: hypothetical protein [unclassified Endozoicomonas]|uniref:hypothetical protein n=2 Tax=Endozoicomonas TaxID=305899 RepID=UPI0021493A32|nr:MULTISPECIES: hypothetical protein [unclassified Endozoicomonas]